jgi:hypothetical protein
MPKATKKGSGNRGGKRKTKVTPISSDPELLQEVLQETPASPPAVLPSDHEDEDVEVPVLDDVTVVDEVTEAVDDQTAHTSARLPGPRSKVLETAITLAPEEEQRVVDFLIANPMIYDKTQREYKSNQAKQLKWESLAKDLGYEAHQLVRWYESMRTQYGRLTSEGKKLKSGDPKKKETLTFLQKWCKENLGFLDAHIRRVKGQLPVSVSTKYFLFKCYYCNQNCDCCNFC